MNEAFVDEIFKRVLEVIKDSQEPQEEDVKDKILILTSKHDKDCHEILEDTTLLEHYHTECALANEYDVNLDTYQAVILCNLTNAVLSKLCEGISDSPFLELAEKAILTGKKIYVPVQEVEIYQYKDTAPKIYYKKMLDKINFLEQAGIVFADKDKILSMLTNTKPTKESKESKDTKDNKALPKEETKQSFTQGSAVVIEKKIITEKDVEQAYEKGAAVICIPKNSILSDLAKEFAKKRDMELQRTDANSVRKSL